MGMKQTVARVHHIMIL